MSSRSHHLSPMVSVEYWRNTPSGIVRVPSGAGDHIVADFAILMTAKPARRVDGTHWNKTAARFELPAQAEHLAVTLAAVDAAYALGHHDRCNRMRAQYGLDPLAKVLPAMRESYDRTC